MYLTQMLLDQKNRQTLAALGSPSKFHGAIEAAFPGPRQRNLWRIDSRAGQKYLLLLSETPPDLTQAAARGSIGRQSRMIRCSPAFCRAAAGSFACVQTRHTVSLQDRGSAGASARTAPRSISLRGCESRAKSMVSPCRMMRSRLQT